MEASSSPIRAALWGVGGHSRRHVLPALARAEKIDLVAIHTRDPDTLADCAAEFSAVPFPSPESMLASPDVDVVYIATPTGLHASMARSAIESGKHVWCEKPLTTSYEATTDLVTLAAANGLVVLETDMFLHHPQFLELRQLLDNRVVGSPLTVTARFGFPHLDRSDFRYSQEAGGGALRDAGFYPIAAAVALIGHRVEVIGASLQTAPGFQVDTSGSALLRGGDQIALLDWGFGRAYRNSIDIWCDSGTIDLARAFSKPPTLTTQVELDDRAGTTRTIDIRPADQFSLMLDAFAEISLGRAEYDARPMIARARVADAITKKLAPQTSPPGR